MYVQQGFEEYLNLFLILIVYLNRNPEKSVLNGDVLKNNTRFTEEIPHVDEVGATSAPLKAASYFIGARCKAYNEDYMLCKAENRRKLEEPCLKEGFRVTRCAISVLEDLHTYCSDQFKKYWKCLDNYNHEFRSCRSQEMEFNKCVFDNLKLEKVIPGVPEGEEPIFLKKRPVF